MKKRDDVLLASFSYITLFLFLSQNTLTFPLSPLFCIQFGEAFESLPRVLAVNSGQGSTSIVSSLYAAHAENSKSELKGPNIGIDIDGGLKDVVKDGIFDLMVTKESGIRLAVDAALTVLRVDQIIMSKQAGGPKPPAQR